MVESVVSRGRSLKPSKQNKNQLFSEMEELLERLAIPLRYEKGDFKGGICTFNNQTQFILNNRLSIGQKLQIVKSEIKNLDLENLFLRPELREYIEKID